MKTRSIIGSLAIALIGVCLTALPNDAAAAQVKSGKGNNQSALVHRQDSGRFERRRHARQLRRFHQARRFRQERRHRIERQALRHHAHQQ